MRKITISILASLLAFAPAALPQSINNFRKYTTIDGLSGNQVRALLQDDRGLLWVGTTKGLDWFDGTRFYQPPIRPRSGELFVSGIQQDSRKNIWITTYYNGIYKYDNNRFENFLPDTVLLESVDNNVMDMLELSPGNYLVATGHHLYKFRDRRFTIFDTALDHRKILIDRMIRLDSNNLLVIPADTKGIYWYSFRPDGSFCSSQLLQHETVHYAYIDEKRIYIAGDRGLTRYNSIGDLCRDHPVEFLRSGSIWYTNNHLFKLQDQRVIACGQRNGRPLTAVNAVIADIDQNTWVATHDGLIKLPRSYFTLTALLDAGVPSTVITAQKDADKILWCGTFDGLIYQKDRLWNHLDRVEGQSIGFVNSLLKDTAGRVWATTNSGLLQLQDGHPRRIATGIFTALSEDDRHIVWCGDTAGNIYQLRNAVLTKAVIKPIVNDLVSAICRDEYGYLWVGYFTHGLVKYEWTTDHWQALQDFSTKTGFENYRIRCLCRDGHGNLLAGTRTRGYLLFPLNQRTCSSVRNITRESNGLSDNWIKRILVDKNGSLLLANGQGLDVLAGDPANPTVARISFSDGENILEPYSLDKVDSSFLIGSINSLIGFDPAKGIARHPPPKVFFTRIAINGITDSLFVPYAADNGTLQLGYHQNNLSFDFCGVNFEQEKNVHYRYMLEGSDKTWGSPVSGAYLNYSNLPPGHYRLKVAAQNEAGAWGIDPATVSFIIAAPFWKQGWFIVVVSIALLGVVYFAYRYRLEQLLAIERLRTNIATDLHDDMGSTLSSISILSNMARKESNSIENKEMMAEITSSSALLMEKMEDIVWSINPRNDTLEDLMARIKHFASKLLEAKGIEYDIDIGETARQVKLPMLFRQHIYLILKEAVNNLVKYSSCTEARIGIRADSKFLVASVSDNGIGFDPSAVREGNGLLNMSNRAAAMRAGFSAESVPGKGTTISLRVKIK